MEIEVNGQIYGFKFGFGFLKEINKDYKSMVELGVTIPSGLRYQLSAMLDGNMDSLLRILMVANKTEKPRISESALIDYLDDEDTDIDALKDEIVDFLEKSNACKTQTKALLTALQEKKAEAKPQK